jgi:hypothetical protein
MPEQDVRSPITTGVRVTKGRPGPGSSQPLSPGARSDPTARSRGDQAAPSEPQPPGPPASAPQDDARRRRKGERGAELRVTQK